MTKQGIGRIGLGLIGLLLLANTTSLQADATTTLMLQEGRSAFFKSIQNEQYIPVARRIFTELAQIDSSQRAVTTVYQGALTAIAGRHAFLPTTKYKLVKDGLAEMDAAVTKDGNNLEIRFIRGMTNYYLPFFFGRSDIHI